MILKQTSLDRGFVLAENAEQRLCEGSHATSIPFRPINDSPTRTSLLLKYRSGFEVLSETSTTHRAAKWAGTNEIVGC